MKTNLLKIDDILEDILSFREYPESSIPQIKKLASDFARKIETDEQLVHKVALLEVDDHTVRLPDDHSIILQVAFKEYKTKEDHHNIPKKRIKEWVERTYDGSNCEVKITMDCPDCHKEECDHTASYVTVNVDDLWRQQHPEYFYMHMDHMYKWGGMNKDNIPRSPYCDEFKIIRYASHYFSNATKHINGCINIDSRLGATDTEYTINNGVLKINREAGQLIVAYMAKQTDEEGWHLVPDLPEVIEGIQWYVEEKLSYAEWRKTENKNDFLAHNTAKSERRRLQAVIHEKLQTPSYTAWMSFLSNRWKRTIKDHNYYGNSNRYHKDMHTPFHNRLSRK